MSWARTLPALVLMMTAFAGSGPASASEFPDLGSRFGCDFRPKNNNGWQCDGGGFYSNAGKEDCCIDTFYPFTDKVRGRTFRNLSRVLLVRTKPVTRRAIDEVVEVVLVERTTFEEFYPAASDCAMNGDDAFPLSVVNRRKKTIVGIYWDGMFKQKFSNWRVFPCADN